MLINISDDFCLIFIRNPIFWIQETDNSNGVPILCQIAFSSLSSLFLSGWNCFKGLVRNLNLECAWRQSYHSIKRIINPAFLSQRDADMARRFAERLKAGQLVEGTIVQDNVPVLYSTAIHGTRNVFLRDWNWNRVICQGRQIRFEYLKFCRVFSTVLDRQQSAQQGKSTKSKWKFIEQTSSEYSVN